jgi:thiamine biosynthesis lipoprotein
VSFINAHAGERPVQVEPRLFGLLQLAQRIHRETEGAFDITIGPLMRCWGFLGGSGVLPHPEQIAAARAQVGMEHVILDERRSTIRFARPGMMLDLGSIGKGYALDMAVESLREAGMDCALVHGGTSTVCALGAPPDGGGWKVAIDAPPGLVGTLSTPSELATPASSPPPLAVVSLAEESLSVSAPHGKCFQVGYQSYGHVLDPRTGAPCQGAVLAAVILPSATETDAFSTALLLSGSRGSSKIAQLRPGMRTLVAERTEAIDRITIDARGIVPLSAESA